MNVTDCLSHLAKDLPLELLLFLEGILFEKFFKRSSLAIFNLNIENVNAFILELFFIVIRFVINFIDFIWSESIISLHHTDSLYCVSSTRHYVVFFITIVALRRFFFVVVLSSFFVARRWRRFWTRFFFIGLTNGFRFLDRLLANVWRLTTLLWSILNRFLDYFLEMLRCVRRWLLLFWLLLRQFDWRGMVIGRWVIKGTRGIFLIQTLTVEPWSSFL